jgi:hypothetical protein
VAAIYWRAHDLTPHAKGQISEIVRYFDLPRDWDDERAATWELLARAMHAAESGQEQSEIADDDCMPMTLSQHGSLHQPALAASASAAPAGNAISDLVPDQSRPTLLAWLAPIFARFTTTKHD